MKNFARLVFTTILFAAVSTAKAQFYQDVKGTAIKENSSGDIEGSPYLTDTWADGWVVVDKGTYNNLKLKYDLKDDVLIFAGKDNTPMSFAETVKEFNIDGRSFASGFPPAGPLLKNAFYEVLADGNVKLLKHYAKRVQETKTYGAAAVNREYSLTETYFILKDGKMIPVKPDKRSLLEALNDKTAQLDAYLKTNKVNFKNDAALGKLVDYYNTL